MHVSVSLLPSPADDSPRPDIAIVIDVLRATSVMATALVNGAEQIITCPEVAQARRWKEQLGARALLCGERACQRIEGFDLGNSPAEYTPATVDGRTLVLTTTNGTRAIHAARHAKRIITASFLNLTSAVDAIGDASHVQLVCAGTDGQETREDVLLAGAIAAAARQQYQGKLVGDGASLATDVWSSFRQGARSLAEELRETAGGRNLLRYGFEHDLDRCAAVDSLAVVPEQVGHDPPTFCRSLC